MQKKRFRMPKITTLIGAGTSVEGNLIFSGSIHVDGTVHGNVIADSDDSSTLILSEKGLVEGDVRVPNAFLNGRVVGDVRTSRRVELDSHARVTGTLFYRLLEMSMGAEVNGQLVCTEEERPPSMKSVPGAPDAPAPEPVAGRDVTQRLRGPAADDNS